MPQWLQGLTGLEVFFVVCAGVGGILFLVRLVLLMVGHTDDLDTDMSGGDLHETADDSFRLLSVQSLTAFFLMFGLVGLACTRQAGLSPVIAVAAGLAAGAGTVYVIGKIFTGMKRLQADGTLDLANAVGQEGTVYLTVKPDTGGQVSIPIQGRLQTFSAALAGGEAIPTGMSVVVMGVTGGNVLVVKRKTNG